LGLVLLPSLPPAGAPVSLMLGGKPLLLLSGCRWLLLVLLGGAGLRWGCMSPQVPPQQLTAAVGGEPLAPPTSAQRSNGRRHSIKQQGARAELVSVV
jgi:hypothetical protein